MSKRQDSNVNHPIVPAVTFERCDALQWPSGGRTRKTMVFGFWNVSFHSVSSWSTKPVAREHPLYISNQWMRQ
jgi:hypothetical protein